MILLSGLADLNQRDLNQDLNQWIFVKKSSDLNHT